MTNPESYWSCSGLGEEIKSGEGYASFFTRHKLICGCELRSEAVLSSGNFALGPGNSQDELHRAFHPAVGF